MGGRQEKPVKAKGGKTCAACAYRDEGGYCTYIQDTQSYLWVSANTTCKFWASNTQKGRKKQEAQQRAQEEQMRQTQQREEQMRPEQLKGKEQGLPEQAQSERQERRPEQAEINNHEYRERAQREEQGLREREEQEKKQREREKLREIEGILEKLSDSFLDVLDQILVNECAPPAFDNPPDKKTLIDIAVKYMYNSGNERER